MTDDELLALYSTLIDQNPSSELRTLLQYTSRLHDQRPEPAVPVSKLRALLLSDPRSISADRMALVRLCDEAES